MASNRQACLTQQSCLPFAPGQLLRNFKSQQLTMMLTMMCFQSSVRILILLPSFHIILSPTMNFEEIRRRQFAPNQSTMFRQLLQDYKKFQRRLTGSNFQDQGQNCLFDGKTQHAMKMSQIIKNHTQQSFHAEEMSAKKPKTYRKDNKILTSTFRNQSRETLDNKKTLGYFSDTFTRRNLLSRRSDFLMAYVKKTSQSSCPPLMPLGNIFNNQKKTMGVAQRLQEMKHTKDSIEEYQGAKKERTRLVKRKRIIDSEYPYLEQQQSNVKQRLRVSPIYESRKQNFFPIDSVSTGRF